MASHQGFSARMGSVCAHTQRHTEFVLGLAPLLARWQYGSVTNEGHRSCANSLSPLADSTKSSFLPRSYDSGELIISQESQKHRHTHQM